ncbi:hypothetical protein [Roseomonas sp. 18066]|uniref:hypothetical protein n=1 Tax=Roseomonas sp. 18066 TaxID=2681412 RepID=UPI0013592172|nr:hypothetical protein [Roseomonas sp. 18066]
MTQGKVPAASRRSRRHTPAPIAAEPLLSDGQRRWVLALLAGGIGLGLVPVLVPPASPLYWLALGVTPALLMPLAWFLGGERLGRRLDAWLLLGGRRAGAQAQPVAALPPEARRALEQAALPALLGAVSRVANGKRAALAGPARQLLAVARDRLDDPAAIALMIDRLPATVAALEANDDAAGDLATALAQALLRGAA